MATEEDVRLYQYYKNQGKSYAAEGNIGAAIRATQKAYDIHASDRLDRRLEKLKAYFKEVEGLDYSEDCEEDIEENSPLLNQEVVLGEGFRIQRKLYKKLYHYQQEGISWLWGLHTQNKGGVLGDDMGLGKTIQIIGFLSSLIDQMLIKHALIVMPVSLITNWTNEFDKWAPDTTIATFHSQTKSQRERNLMQIQRTRGVLITSYGMIVSNVDLFKSIRGQNFVWDYIVLDEGHKIKNPTKTTKAIHEIPAKHRLVLTGTPIQNNLKELWALYDFCHQGTLLGSLPTFKMQYETIITRSREKNATSGERKLGNMMAESLRELIAPYFLRRTKQEVLCQQQQNKENQDPVTTRPEKQMSKLPQKNDFIVWLHLSDIQIPIYDDFLKTDQVKNLLMTKKSPLVALTVLKKICDHPRLLSARACLQLGMNGEISQDELEELLANEETSSPSIDVDHDILLKESGKLSVLLELLLRLKEEGHKTLVFSQSRKMLDIINNILLARNWKVMRLDGTIRKLEEREACVQKFQTSDIYSVMLLTTQVGGVGLTLTAADRVVIYDPSWNPATDAQAVDRAYRIGQKKPVVIYRLITCGTVEEKIYRRQIFKDSITRKTTGASEDPHRYFTNMELKELFRLDDPMFSSTQRQLEEMHAHQREVYPELQVHLDYLHGLNIFGISDHDLMFKGQLNESVEHDENPAENEQDFIRSQVEKAKLLLQLESEHAYNENVRSGTFCKDLTNFQKPRPKQTTTGNAIDVDEYPPGPSEAADESFGIQNVSTGSVEVLTEEEIEDMKNISISDPEFAKALDVSLREYKSRIVQKTPVKSEPSMSYDADLNLALELSLREYKVEEERKKETVTNSDTDFERALKLSIAESMSLFNRETEEKCNSDTPEKMSEVVSNEKVELDFETALEMVKKLNEHKEVENEIGTESESTSNNADLDFDTALERAIQESMLYKSREEQEEEEQLAKAIELSQADASIFEISHEEDDSASALELSLCQAQGLVPRRQMSLREETSVKSQTMVDTPSLSESKYFTPRRSEILVVESDFDESDFEINSPLPDLDQTADLMPSTSKAFLVRTSFSAASGGLSFDRKSSSAISDVPETDEEHSFINSGPVKHSYSTDSSDLVQSTRRPRRRLESSTDEDDDSSTSLDSTHKRTRLTPELESLDLTGSLQLENSTALFSGESFEEDH